MIDPALARQPVDRYCFVRLVADQASPAGRAAALARLRTGLAGVPGLLRLTTGTPADDSAARWDLAVVARFASLASLASALASPAWQGAFDELTASAVVVKAWSFTAED